MPDAEGPVGMGEPMVRTELRPGDIGTIIALHGELYGREAGFDHTFEAYVAETVGECFASWDDARDRIWLVELGDRVLGSLVLKGREPTLAQLRYFLLDPALRGHGLGRRLVRDLIDFARAAGYARIFLLTDESVTGAAIHLYRESGFRRTGERAVERWGNSQAEQRYELDL